MFIIDYAFMQRTVVGPAGVSSCNVGKYQIDVVQPSFSFHFCIRSDHSHALPDYPTPAKAACVFA